jgi:GNAT superfamily N-acetyltransferase
VPAIDETKETRVDATQPGILVRPAQRADVEDILQLVRELADYEQLAHEVTGTSAELEDHLFGPRPFAQALLAQVGSEVAGFALAFHNYSTFLCRPGLYLEDLFVRPRFRRLGIGRRLLAALARQAVDLGCGRLEWSVLDWNAPSIEFYRGLGARSMDEWTMFRLTGDALIRLAEGESAARATTAARLPVR